MTPRPRPAAALARLLAVALCAATPCALPAVAAAQVADGHAACAAVADDRERLACHDRASGRAPSAAGAPASSGPASSGPASSAPAPSAPAPSAPAPSAPVSGVPVPGTVPAGPALPLLDERAIAARDERRSMPGTLGERWELDPGSKQGRFLLRPYKPTYVLPVHWTSDVNLQPRSDGAGNSVPVAIPNKPIDATFQLSLKSKLLETVGGTNVDVWMGYTQLSHWQVYNPELSRPFRETNYEPEVFAVWGFDRPLLGWRARLLGLSLVHQSNGRSEPLSRSWNRVIATFGAERGDWSVLLRPWWRLPEDRAEDDNPGIEDYVGRGELIVMRRSGAHLATLQLRHSLKGGDRSRGSVQLDWAFPVSSYLKGHLRLFSGYGESLIDFNHRQTTIGVGVSLAEWL
jgi:phospholipase A1